MISHLGPQLGVQTNCTGKQIKTKQPKQFVLLEGATSEGDFHEALNIAAVWDLPVYSLSKTMDLDYQRQQTKQYRCETFADKGAGYGMESHIIDGNNILEVYTKSYQINP
jgi:2-oxoisovalerate dehydrogenase E1 component